MDSSVFESIVETISMTKEEADKNLLQKNYDGIVTLKYKNNQRAGVILSLSSNGSYGIGILPS
jgi:hypothetical protein